MASESRPPPRVFISYADDSEQHTQQVHEFAWFLRAGGGIDTRLDLWDADQRRDWSTWVIEQLRNAEYVLVVASPAYRHRAEGSGPVSDGRGLQFETALLRDLLTQDRATWVPKILPIILPGRSVDDIPVFLQPYSASHYVVDSLTIDGIDGLYRVITGQPRHQIPRIGRLVTRPPVPPVDRSWRPGLTIELGVQNYLILAVDGEESSPDGSWVRRQALAGRPGRPHQLVMLRQVQVLTSNDSATQLLSALLAEGALLAELAHEVGIPRLLDQVSHRDVVTLVLERPDAPNLRDLYGPPHDAANIAAGLDPTRIPGFLRTMHRLCRTLQSLHQRGLSHRALTPDAVLLVEGGRTAALRDVGLATMAPTSAESPALYQAPEQRHAGPPSTAPGVRTDVFQLAAIIHHTLIGHLSSVAIDPRLPQALVPLLADALSPVPDHRPRDAATLGASLMRAVDHL